MKTFVYTSQGGRSNNEDFAVFREKEETGEGVWALADGLGGHDCGEVASRIAAEGVLRLSKETPADSEEALLSIMNAANALVLEHQTDSEATRFMRTTVVAAFADGKVVRYFNVGDSRFYYFKNGRLSVQSKDHSVSQVAVNLGEITKTQIRFHDDRNKLLKVLGNEPELKISRLDPPIEMEPGDAFLLCSDGFWEYVYETEMEIDLLKSEDPQEWVEWMVNRLLLRVTNNNDNFTAVGVFV